MEDDPLTAGIAGREVQRDEPPKLVSRRLPDGYDVRPHGVRVGAIPCSLRPEDACSAHHDADSPSEVASNAIRRMTPGSNFRSHRCAVAPGGR